jgi:hypothetical protein
MTACGQRQLDRDGDGIPCEVVCGKSLESMRSRMTAQPFATAPATALAATDRDPALQTANIAPEPRQTQSSVDTSAFKCGDKRTCSEMTSCEEARFHHTQCGIKRLDGTGNGIPCKSLCTR